MPRPVHFEIHAADTDRAIDFYTTVFSWQFNKIPEMNYWGVVTGSDDEPGINGGLMPRLGPPPKDAQPVNAWVCTVGVDNIDAYVDAAVEAGGTVATPKFAIPGVGWVAYVKDTESNILGLHQADETAV